MYLGLLCHNHWQKFATDFTYKTEAFILQFRAKVDPKKWPIGKDDPDPIIAEDSSAASTDDQKEPESSSASEPEPKVAVEPILNPNVPEFVPSFAAAKVNADDDKVVNADDDEAGTDGDTEDEPEDKKDADWVEVILAKLSNDHDEMFKSSELTFE